MLEHWYYILAIPLYKLISNLINLHNTKKDTSFVYNMD